MNFERGIDPKKALGLGWEKVFDEMGGLIFYKESIYQNINHHDYSIQEISLQNIAAGKKYLYKASIIIVVVDNQFKIIKNTMGNDGGNSVIYSLSELPEIIFKIKREFEERNFKSFY
jgi:hypothetical protein